MRHVVILGAGTAGTIMANRLMRLLAREVRAQELTITVVDRDDRHLYQPGLLFIPFGTYGERDVVKPRRRTLPAQVNLVLGDVARIDVAGSVVELADGRALPYDVLVVATGAHLHPGKTAGLTGAGWRERVFDFYTLDGALALRDALAAFKGGRLLVNAVDVPIKCPVALLEFAVLADACFTERDVREQVAITVAMPVDASPTAPAVGALLNRLVVKKDMTLVTEFNTVRVDGANGVLHSRDGRQLAFDLLVTIPLHGGAPFVSRSAGLGDEHGYVIVDPHLLQARCAPNIFALGDAAALPSAKSGAMAQLESRALAPNIARYLRRVPLARSFDGHTHDVVETGFNRAMLVESNLSADPTSGNFRFDGDPVPGFEDSRLAHEAHRAFRWAYWNVVLPGRDLPGTPQPPPGGNAP